MNKLLMSALIMLIGMIGALAVPTVGGNVNTNPPSGDRGHISQGDWGAESGTVVADRYFLASKHVGGSIGDVYSIGGTNYTTISKTNHPTLDLTLWKVNKKFPANVKAVMCSSTNLVGKGMVTFGRGYERGDPIFRSCSSLKLTNFVKGNCDEFDVIGGTPGARYMIQSSTNLTDWVTLPGKYPVWESMSNHIVLPSNNDPQLFYRTVVVDSNIGWKFGVHTGQRTWGTNVLYRIDYDDGSFTWYSTIDRDAGGDECGLFPGDSSGGMFVFDGGQWKLAGVNSGSIWGFFSIDGGSLFTGTLMDLSGVNWDGWVFPITHDENPSVSFYCPIPVDWISANTGGS